MSGKIESVKTLIDTLTPSELQGLASHLRSKLPKHALEEKWGISYELILNAIHRSQDIVQRGVRGVIAEAVFEADVVPTIRGWHPEQVTGDLPYDFKIQRDSDKREIKIQVKLQRMRGGKPLTRSFFGPETFIVEVQKTRSGIKHKPKQAVPPESAPAAPEQTRPYQFGDFDLIAVNMQPSMGDWKRFMYTVASWLLPRAGNERLIEIMQPVSGSRTTGWTDNIEECIHWFLSGKKKVVFDMDAARKALLEERKARAASRRKKPLLGWLCTGSRSLRGALFHDNVAISSRLEHLVQVSAL